MRDTTGYILVKTQLGYERIVASYINELEDPAIEDVIPAPRGFKGLVLVMVNGDPHRVAKLIEDKIPEADKVIPIESVCRADPQEIASKTAEIARRVLKPGETFAVRTVRRGKHGFTSIDVNVITGDSIRKATNAVVDLSNPDWVFRVEIIQDKAYIAVVPGSKEYKKMRPGKYPVYKFFRKLSIIQMPYLGPEEASYKMGERIGRAAQTFEVRELVIALSGRVKAEELMSFLRGVYDGIESRYKIQVKSYGRDVHRVPVFIQDIHQIVRERSGDVIIVFEPEGEAISKLGDKLYDLLKSRRRINLFFGSREGIPVGIYRFADLIIDIAPGVTISTEYAMTSALIALSTLLHEKLQEEGVDNG